MPVPITSSFFQNPLIKRYAQTGSLAPNVSGQLNPTLSRDQFNPQQQTQAPSIDTQTPITAPPLSAPQQGLPAVLPGVQPPTQSGGLGQHFGTAQTLQQIGGAGSQLLASQSPDFSAQNTITQQGLSTLSSQGLQAGVKSGAVSSGVGTAAGIGSAVGDIAGEALSNDGKEELGGALGGAAKGAAAGAVLGPWGIAGGAVIGGVAGALGGKKKRAERRKREKAQAFKKLRGAELQGQEARGAQRIQSASNFDQYGNRVSVARNGIKIDTPFNLKKGNHKSLIPLNIEPKPLKFKRGGKTDKQAVKQNIIPDGPTHGRLNKTGVKGDKGLPVVSNGEKQYEIEKEEFILNLGATNKAEKLNDRFNLDKDNKHLVALGKLMKYELMNNTYDYTKRFNVNRGSHIKYKESESMYKAPGKGEFSLKETDVLAHGGKMQVLGNDGEVLTNIIGGERIFSRPHTKKLISLAKTAKDKSGLLKLGEFMSSVIGKQDTQESQYVS